MSGASEREVREFWNAVADDWRTQVGGEGDINRRLNSDPVLWELAGDVEGKRVLDAGCGTGYLTKKLHDRGAHVVGVDLSEEMIALAQASYAEIDFRVDSISRLDSVEDGAFELVVANYVLMDTPDLEGAMATLHRVLAPEGVAVLVFSHPCFPQGRRSEDGGSSVTYTWQHPYFERARCVDPPWGHFRTEFIWFHRPLSDYWKAFVAAGFTVEAFEEPRISEEARALVESEKMLRKLMTRPYSVAFKLRKQN